MIVDAAVVGVPDSTVTPDTGAPLRSRTTPERRNSGPSAGLDAPVTRVRSLSRLARGISGRVFVRLKG
jgi:hypothetical protein